MAGVPHELMARLHAANEEFHRARMAAEAGLKAAENPHRADLAQALRAAEAELEAVTKEIDTCLAKQKPAQSRE